MFKELGWLTFRCRCEYHTSVMIYKSLNNLTPNYIAQLITLSKISNYSLRSTTRKDIAHLNHRTMYFKHTFGYSGMIVWNTIPVNMKALTSLASFKNNYKSSHIMDY